MADPFPAVARGGGVRDGGEQGGTAGQLVATPSRLRTAVASMLNRAGHARFRRAPVVVQEKEEAARDVIVRCDGLSASASSSFPSSVTGVTGDGSVSNARAVLPAAVGRSAGGDKPSPMQFGSYYASAGRIKRNSDDDGERCHCSKKRKASWRARRRIRVPAISSRNADIPADDYSWRKYGQKPIKGSPYPRGYYKCSTVRGCPARKHVERDPGEPAMLIVTYDGDHRHREPGPGEAVTTEHRTTDRLEDDS